MFSSSSDEDESEESDEDEQTSRGVTVRTLTKEELQKGKLLIQNQVVDSESIVLPIVLVAAIQEDESSVFGLVQVKVSEELLLILPLSVSGPNQHRSQILNQEQLLESARLIEVLQHMDQAVQDVGIFALVLLSLGIFALLELVKHPKQLLIV